MPFTVSHVVAVLPLVVGRPATKLVPAALVIGSMIPDLPYFVPPHRGAEWSHSASGPVTIDLMLGLAVFAIWHFLLAEPLADFSPDWLRPRLPPRKPVTLQRWLWAGVSVVLGATTHALWDTFTHRGRWGTRHVGWLTDVHGGLAGYKWFQYASGVVGMAVLLLWLVHRLARSRPEGQRRGLVPPRSRVLAWLSTSAVFAGALSLTWRAGAQERGVWLDEALAVHLATATMSLTAAAVLVECLVWQAWRRQIGRIP